MSKQILVEVRRVTDPAGEAITVHSPDFVGGQPVESVCCGKPHSVTVQQGDFILVHLGGSVGQAALDVLQKYYTPADGQSMGDDGGYVVK